MEKTKEYSDYKVSESEQKVLEIMRGIEYGEIRIIINNSKPVRIEEIKKSVQL